MWDKKEERARLSARILDMKRRIAEGQEQDALDGHPWDRSAGVRMVELLIASLADWEARLAALQNSDEE